MNIFSTSCNTIRSQQVTMNHQLQTNTDTRQAHLTPALSPLGGRRGRTLTRPGGHPLPSDGRGRTLTRPAATRIKQALTPRLPVLLCAVALAIASRLGAAEVESLDEHLAPLRPFIGKTWKGEFKNSTPENPRFDISRWERALNGKAVRVLHSVNNGSYGGETLIVWDAEQKKVVSHYFTTAGFHTIGTVAFDGTTKYIVHEKVIGNSNGITEVKAVGELKPDGSYHSSSQYFKDGEWTPGHAVIYRETPDAKIVFK